VQVVSAVGIIEQFHRPERFQRCRTTLLVFWPTHFVDHIEGDKAIGQELGAVRAEPKPEKHCVRTGKLCCSNKLRMVKNLVVQFNLAHAAAFLWT
jgi:hypothetical protein